MAEPQAASQRLAVLPEVPAQRGLREVKAVEVRQARPPEPKLEVGRLQMAVPAVAPMLLVEPMVRPEVQAERAAMGRYRRP